MSRRRDHKTEPSHEERLKDFNVTMVSNVVSFADALLADDDDSLLPRPEEAFDAIAYTLQLGVEIGELTRKQALGRLALFAQVGALVNAARNVTDLQQWFEQSAQVFTTAQQAELV